MVETYLMFNPSPNPKEGFTVNSKEGCTDLGPAWTTLLQCASVQTLSPNPSPKDGCVDLDASPDKGCTIFYDPGANPKKVCVNFRLASTKVEKCFAF